MYFLQEQAFQFKKKKLRLGQGQEYSWKKKEMPPDMTLVEPWTKIGIFDKIRPGSEKIVVWRITVEQNKVWEI